MNRCGAKTRSGAPCKNAAMIGGPRCRFHGGKTPKGVASPHTRHGRYSRHLPTRLRERFEASEADPDLLNLRHEIALVDARTSEMLAIIEDGASPLAWEMITALVEQRRKLVETERKRLVDMQQMITAEQAAVLVAALTDAVRRHVDDPDTLGAISTEFDRLLARTGA